MTDDPDFPLKSEGYRILGAAFEVYKQLGHGYREIVYQDSLALEFQYRGIPFVAYPKLPLYYKGECLNHFFIPDFICFETVLVELKAIPELLDRNLNQLHNYLMASGLQVGYILNFGHYPLLQHDRKIWNPRNRRLISSTDTAMNRNNTQT